MMTSVEWLEEVSRVGGVRAAALVAAADGLVVREVAMDGVSTADIAALASAVVRRAELVLAACGDEATRMVTLVATLGTVIAVQGTADLWLVVVTESGAELGRLRLLLGDLAPGLA